MIMRFFPFVLVCYVDLQRSKLEYMPEGETLVHRNHFSQMPGMPGLDFQPLSLLQDDVIL